MKYFKRAEFAGNERRFAKAIAEKYRLNIAVEEAEKRLRA